jgi:hypothetical protein
MIFKANLTLAIEYGHSRLALKARRELLTLIEAAYTSNKQRQDLAFIAFGVKTFEIRRWMNLGGSDL